ncbi:SUMO-specific isopeptidase USPL1-like [Ylistrum balloti]|uniref:SUMO-specific isopeptidase USPL1-like n=1 Tax=Ylistrum balloti TaxID=509963 RepID=UPI002905E411|nr:SUMO-specific isopeptidase USPL1-like [Ylistrum balloti]XP_060078046.1 SUMO-specific isopeptidase USPL1-like [Ylistrum balloti]
MEGQEICCVCARNGKTSKLKTYQINFEEAIRFCEDDECTYPAGMDNSSWVLNRKFSELEVNKPSTMKKKSLPQLSHPSSIKHPGNNHRRQKTESKSPSYVNADPVKAKLSTIQNHLKNEKDECVPASSISSTKTGQTFSSCNKFQNKSGSKNSYPAFSLSKDVVKQRTKAATSKKEEEIGMPLSCIKSNKDKKNLKVSNFDATIETRLVGKETYCPSTVDQLRTFYPQWQNKDALCWMDVILCLLVHCKQVNKLCSGDQGSESSMVCTLVKAYDQAVALMNERPITSKTVCFPSDVNMTVLDDTGVKTHVNSTSTLLSEEKFETQCIGEDTSNFTTTSTKHEDDVKTGAGLQLLKSDFLQLMSLHSHSEYSKAFDLLGDVREQIWHQLHPRLRCKKGQNDSPVFAIPLLTKNSKDLEQLLAIKYSFHFECTKCGFQDIFPQNKVLPTFPNTAQKFSMKDPKFLRPCFQCLADGQTMTMRFERLPPVLMLHFQEGLHSNIFSSYDFYHQNRLYQVTGVIQYRNDPDHFIAWIRNPKEELWMECNDLKSPVCQFDQSSPGFPASQVHIVMWETVGPEDDGNITVQNSTKSMCNQDSPRNGNVEVSMETGVSSENGLMSFIMEKGGTSDNVAENLNSVAKSTTSRSVSLLKQNSLNGNAMGNKQMTKDPSNIKGGSNVCRKTSLKSSGKNVPFDKLNMASSPRPAEPKKDQFGNNSKGVLLHTKKSYRGASNSHKDWKGSAHSDKILEKTKDNVSFLRNMKNPRLSQTSCEPRDHQKSLQCLQGQGSLSFLSRILGNSKTKTTVSPILKGKVFEGYKSRTFDQATSIPSKARTKSLCGESDTESSVSRPNSPALSCHSDSFVIQKRKVELVSENNTLPALKRRRSHDTNFTLIRPAVHMKSLSLDTGTSLSNEGLVYDKTAVSALYTSSVETKTIDSQCSNNELLTSVTRTDCTFQESDILQSLYSALNIDMPANNDDNKPPVKAVGAAPMDVENIPDISDLDKFINSSCDSNMEDNFDDFLSEL